MGRPNRLVVGISGASGAIYGIRLLEALRTNPDIETHLVLSRTARRTIVEETDWTVAAVRELADQVYPTDDVGASLASGSFPTRGMVVAPCSMRSLAEIASGNTTGLLTRAADVTLKERRRLVLVTREAPLRLAHLRNMTAVTEEGGIVVPPVPAFYTRPGSVDDIVNHTVGRVLDLFDIDPGDLLRRWGE